MLDDALKFFSATGEYLGQVEPKGAEFIQSNRIAYTDSGLAIFRETFPVFREGETVRRETLEIRIVDAGGDRENFPVQTFARSAYRLAWNVTGPPLMASPARASVTRDARTLVPDPEHFAIDVWSARGDRLERIAAVVPRIAASDADLDDLLEEYGTFLKFDDTFRQRYARALRDAPRARYRPAIWEIVPARTGHLLVERRDLGVHPYNPYDARSRKVWLVIAPDWTPVGAVTLPGRFRPKVFTGCSIIGYETDHMHVVLAARYDLDHLCLVKLTRFRGHLKNGVRGGVHDGKTRVLAGISAADYRVAPSRA